MSRYRETMAEALRKVYEDGHEDVSSSKRMCQTIVEDATQIRTKLDSMSAEDKLDTWWTNKLAKSADNLNSARDYIMNPIEEELQERTYDPIQFGPDKVAKAMAIATKSSGQYSVAVRDIEKIARNLSKVSTIARELKKQNEEVELDEGRMKDIYTMQQDGKSAKEIAKLMKLPIKTVKDILGEGEEIEESLDEFTSDMIKRLQKSYSTMPKTISPEQAKALSKHLDRLDLSSLKQLTKAKIPFVTTLARNKVYKKTGKFEEVEQPEKEKKETENKDSVIATLKDQIAMLKQKLENEKNKAVKPEPNPETGEVPLTIGLANKLLKDKEMKKEDVQEADLTKPQIKKVHKMADELPKKDFKDRYGKEKGDAVRYATATNIVKKKLGIEENQADMMFKKLSQRAQTYVNELLRSGMGTMEAIAKAKEKFKESDMNESKEQKLRNMKTVIDMLDGTHGRIIASKSDLQKLMNLTKKMNNLENPRGPSSSEKKDYENLVKKYSNQLGSKRNEYLGYLKDIMKEQTINEDRRLYVEKIAGLKKKAEKSGMPYSILKKVFDRGMAAWKGGHRPGASQHQWAFARVNSFVTKSSGTWGGADKDLAKQVRGSK